MIHPFAIQPEVVLGWGADPAIFSYIKKSFGRGSPRVLLELPKYSKWKSLASTTVLNDPSITDHQRKRVEVLIKLLGEGSVRRFDLAWDGNQRWLDSAMDEWSRRHFRAVIAESGNSEAVLEASSIVEDPPPERWRVDGEDPVEFQMAPEGYASCLMPLLREDLEICFIDPYLEPGKKERDRVILELAQEAAAYRRPTKFVIKSSAEGDMKLPDAYFDEKAQEVGRRLPASCTIQFDRLEELPRGDKFHNRYVMTASGGLKFGNSFFYKEGGGQTDSATIMGPSLYRQIWSKYMDCEGFKVVHSITVSGRR